MFNIEETNYGYRMNFDGFLKRDEVAAWVAETKKTLKRARAFGILVDLRGASAFPADAQDTLFEGILYCKERGMERASIVVANPISKIQAIRFTKETGIYPLVRYLDASSDPDWEQGAMDWLLKGIDPD